MGEGGFKIRNQSAVHFITFSVVEWVDVFTRRCYCDIVIDSLRYCQDNKGLLVHCWCIMSNHVHLILSAKENNLSDILRDFKRFTSRNIVSAIIDHSGESRKNWMVDIFKQRGDGNKRNEKYQFWQQENHPIEIFSLEFIGQKVCYIHNNPVKAGFVRSPENYTYSSAIDYAMREQCGLLKIDFLF